MLKSVGTGFEFLKGSFDFVSEITTFIAVNANTSWLNNVSGLFSRSLLIKAVFMEYI